MEVREARRMAVTVLVLALALAAWLGLLWLHARGGLQTAIAADALEAMGLGQWTAIGVAGALVLALLLAATVIATDVLPAGWARGAVRQVQCGDCKAVFFLSDNGHRPITHLCPNCKRIGVYDGKAQAVGEVPVGGREVVRLRLRCRNCLHRFPVLDTGIRPLRITCPKCRASGGMH